MAISRHQKSFFIRQRCPLPARRHANAFTLIELLLVIAIIAVLAGIVIVAVNPSLMLSKAQDVKRSSQAKQLQNALNQYVIDKGGLLSDFTTVSTSATSPTEMCKIGATDHSSCFVIDMLVPAYVAKIVPDIAEPCSSNNLGYSMYRDANNHLFVNTDYLKYQGATYQCDATAASTTTTTTSLIASPASSWTSGLSIQFIAMVSPAPGASAAAVTFSDNGTVIGTGDLNASGVAYFSTTALSLGSHSITASYAGNSNFTPSTSPAVTQNVDRISTTTYISASPNPSTYSNSVELTATVLPLEATGNVSFFDGVIPLGSATLSHGSGSYSTSNLSVGSHSLTVSYGGDSNYTASVSDDPANQLVNLIPTSTALTSPDPVAVGTSITLTASVSSLIGTPTGTVTFSDNGTVIGTGDLNASGVATLITTFSTLGVHSLTVSYGGDGNYDVSVGSLSPTVIRDNTTVSLTSDSPSSPYGTTVHFQATVKKASDGSIATNATGNIQFFDNGTSIGSVAINNGTATLTTSTLSIGSHPIHATFVTDPNYNGNTSNTVSQIINPLVATWIGGSGLLCSTAANWSPSVIPTAGSAVTIATTSNAIEWDSGCPSQIYSLSLNTGFAGTLQVDTTYSSYSAVFTTLTITQNLTVNAGTIIQKTNASPTTQTQSYRLSLAVGGNLLIGSSGKIDVSGEGFAGGVALKLTPDGTACTPPATNCGLGYGTAGGMDPTLRGGGGGGHGGAGGAGYGTSGGGAGGSVDADNEYAPSFLGSGGGACFTAPATGANGGAGGGAILLSVTGTLTNAGNILANGNPGNTGSSVGSGGGAGGTINVTAATLTGAGSFQAVGGYGGLAGTGGGGGGGRISITNYSGGSTTKTGWMGILNAGGGGGYQSGSVGTLNFP